MENWAAMEHESLAAFSAKIDLKIINKYNLFD